MQQVFEANGIFGEALVAKVAEAKGTSGGQQGARREPACAWSGWSGIPTLQGATGPPNEGRDGVGRVL